MGAGALWLVRTTAASVLEGMAEQDGQSGGGADSQSRNTHLTLARDSGGLRNYAPSGICDDGAAKSLVDAFNCHLPRLSETSAASHREQVPTCATCLVWMDGADLTAT